MDAVVSSLSGIHYFHNVGNSTSPSFTQVTDSGNPFYGVIVGSSTYVDFADTDGDGLMDVFVGSNTGEIHYFHNVGTSSSPSFTEVTGSGNPFDNVYVHSNIVFFDADNDGLLDAFAGSRDGTSGTIKYFHNVGNFTSPSFTEVTGSENPFDGADVGFNPTISFEDIDGDGVMEAIVGSAYGTIKHFVDPSYSCRASCMGKGTCGQPDISRTLHTTTADSAFYASIAEFQSRTEASQTFTAGSAPGLCLCFYNYVGDACQFCAPEYYGNKCSLTCPQFSAHGATISYPLHPTIDDCTCSATFTRVGSACVCAPGLRFDATSSSCQRCPSGTFKASSSLDSCTSCEAGTFSLPGAASCSACLSGKYSLGNAEACIPCTSGSYSNEGEGQGICPGCEVGKQSDGTVPCEHCARGKFALGNAETCTACENGKFSSSLGQSSCAACEAGEFSDGTTPCEKCARGKFALGNAGTCTDCESGKFNVGPGLSICSSCEPGSYPDGTSCILCVPGFYAPFGADSCSRCDSGFAAGEESAAFCEPCEAGKHANAANTACVDCVAGKSSALGAASCTDCERGKFVDLPGQSGCTFCDSLDVLKGSTTSGPGAASRSDCSCGPSEYENEKDAECSAAFEGLSSDVDGMSITQLHLEQGYWRTSKDSMEVLPCLSEEHCQSGSAPAENCAEGYSGPLCAVCSEGYAAVGAGAELQCNECTGSSTVTVVVGVSVFLLIFGIFAYRLFKSKGDVGKATTAASVDYERASQVQEKLDVISGLVEKYQPPAKIALSYYQIVCGLSFVYDLRFPKAFTRVINALSSVVNLDFISFMPLGCISETSFHLSLLGYTLGPLITFMLMIVGYLTTKKSNPVFANRIFSYFLALTFLILPSVSIKIFSTFFDGNYGSFLKADYSIDCDSEEHKFYEAYAGLMILVYPVGVPLMYFILLYRRRDELDPGQERFTHELGSEEEGLKMAIAKRERLMLADPSLAGLSFLFGAYEPRCWWFEVVETLRRLLLTGGLLFLNPGTGSQIVASMIMCLAAMRIYAGYKPFIDGNYDLLAETAQWQLFLTMFAALLIRVNLDSAQLQDKSAFDILLCAVQFAAVGVALVKFVACRDKVGAAVATKEEEEKEEVKNARNVKEIAGDELEQGGAGDELEMAPVNQSLVAINSTQVSELHEKHNRVIASLHDLITQKDGAVEVLTREKLAVAAELAGRAAAHEELAEVHAAAVTRCEELTKSGADKIEEQRDLEARYAKLGAAAESERAELEERGRECEARGGEASRLAEELASERREREGSARAWKDEMKSREEEAEGTVEKMREQISTKEGAIQLLAKQNGEKEMDLEDLKEKLDVVVAQGRLDRDKMQEEIEEANGNTEKIMVQMSAKESAIQLLLSEKSENKEKEKDLEALRANLGEALRGGSQERKDLEEARVSIEAMEEKMSAKDAEIRLLAEHSGERAKVHEDTKARLDLAVAREEARVAWEKAGERDGGGGGGRQGGEGGGRGGGVN